MIVALRPGERSYDELEIRDRRVGPAFVGLNRDQRQRLVISTPGLSEQEEQMEDGAFRSKVAVINLIPGFASGGWFGTTVVANGCLTSSRC